MKNENTIKRYTVEELKVMKTQSRTDWPKVDSATDAELERHIAEDNDERDMAPDWTKARLVMPEAKQSIHLRLERDVVEFFKSEGKGHIARMQTVLKAYANAHRNRGGQ